jgi:hypothetical protein
MQTAYRRLRILREAGLILPFTVPGIEESIFSLTRKGLAYVAGIIGVETLEMKWAETKSRPKDYYFMRHFLGINDFRILLGQACEKQGIKLCGFIPDYYGERTEKGVITKYIRDFVCDISTERPSLSHTPDGVFALERDGKPALFFLEIDLGTEVVSNVEKGVLRSILFYSKYLIDGKYDRYAVDFRVETFKGFRTLYLTSSHERLENIRKATTKLDVPRKALKFLWIAVNKEVSTENFFVDTWRSLDPDDGKSYSIL